MSETKRIWIPRETWRQEKAVVFARDAIIGQHKFLAHDRSRPSGKEHMWQARRGVRKGTPDTQLIIPGGRHCWFEFKSPGKSPDDDQIRMLDDLQALGDATDWGTTIDDMRRFWDSQGVPMVVNAAYRAMVLDGLVDSRIAKAEAEARGEASPKKRSATRKSEPRSTASRSMVQRLKKQGILLP